MLSCVYVCVCVCDSHCVHHSLSLCSFRYGKEPDLLVHTTFGTSHTYEAAQMCNAPANQTSQQYFRDPGFIHNVLLKNLELGTTYYYQFGNDKDGWSQVYQFTSVFVVFERKLPNVHHLR